MVCRRRCLERSFGCGKNGEEGGAFGLGSYCRVPVVEVEVEVEVEVVGCLRMEKSAWTKMVLRAVSMEDLHLLRRLAWLGRYPFGSVDMCRAR